MRKPRLKGLAEWEETFFNCRSRIVSAEFYLNDRDKERFLKIMRGYEVFSGIQVLAFCILDCHFHLMLRVPRRPPPHLLPNDTELVYRVRKSGAIQEANTLRQDLKRLRKHGFHEAAEELRERFFCRMWDVSWFMKLLKQRFTQWYNGVHERSGTLWDSRFKSVLVEGSPRMLTLVAARIDMNPVRLGLSENPACYRWCGYAQAMARGRKALDAIAYLFDPERCALAAIDDDLRQRALEAYRRNLYVIGARKEECVTPEGVEPGQRRFSDEQIREVLAKGGRVSQEESTRCRNRYFSEGVAIGCKAFVEEVFQGVRQWFGPKRKSGARPIKGIAAADLYCLRELRKRVFN